MYIDLDLRWKMQFLFAQTKARGKGKAWKIKFADNAFSQGSNGGVAFVLGFVLRVRKEKNSDVAPDGHPVSEEPTKAGADNVANALCILNWVCAGKCNFFLRRPKREGRERRGRSNLQTMHLVRAPMEGLHLFLVLFCVCARAKTVTWLQMATWCRKSPTRRAQVIWQMHYVY